MIKFYKTNMQKGFTLIEIAILLIIIGLFFGGMLQGQQLIENSQLKQALRGINSTATAVLAYQASYNSLPGDDGPVVSLHSRGERWALVRGAGDADGLLEVSNPQTFNGDNESGAFWQHLKAAGLISGNPADSGTLALPRNPWGGLLGINTANMGGNLTGSKVCLSQVPGSAAFSLDKELDDGLGDSGRFRATLGSSGVNTNPSNAALAVPYSEDSIYTICFRI